MLSSTRSPTYEFLHRTYNDAQAVEMEGRGFLRAAHANDRVLSLIVRGISDNIDGKEIADKSAWQRKASRHAAAFAFEILAKVDIDRDDTLRDLAEHQDSLKDFMPTVDAIGDAINANEPDWVRTITTGGSTSSVTFTPRTPGASVRRPIRIEPHIELPDGVSMADLVRHAVETQDAIALGPQHVKGLQVFLGDKTLVEIMDPGSLIFATNPMGPVVLSKLVVRGGDEDST